MECGLRVFPIVAVPITTRGCTAGAADRQSDLGYWMGYRITKSYYDRSPDKRKALNDIFHIRDFGRFLVESGYNPAA
jgi:hypothetical protein